MKLVEAQVEKFRNIVDSTSVSIEDGITCLVGKNESGKTAFLSALYRLNPINEARARTTLGADYPAWRWKRDEKAGHDLSSVELATGIFELTDADRAAVAEAADVALPKSSRLYASRTFGGDLLFDLSVDEKELVEGLLGAATLDPKDLSALEGLSTTDDLLAKLDELPGEDGDPGQRTLRHKQVKQFKTQVRRAKTVVSEGDPHDKVLDVLESRLPTFFFFTQYSSLRGVTSLERLAHEPKEEWSAAEETAMALLELAGVTPDELMEEDYESRVQELRAAANNITNEVFKYWTQNENLNVRFDINKQTRTTPRGQQAVIRDLRIRIDDLLHQVDTSFDVRSSGFRWFFSFIAAFSEYENREDDVIVLLDEPGMGLHAKAQDDFLRFIDDRLGTRHQVVYTTHSPFMVQPSRLERVRVVEDKTTRDNPDVGSVITSEVLTTDPDTLFPLQAALGYDLAQNLFVGENNLVIEGTADFTYLTSLSEHLDTLGRDHLAPKWTLVPAGGADKIPTFVALLGPHLDVAVLIDSSTKGVQRIMNFASSGLLQEQRIVTVAQATKTNEADIEDLFEPQEYLDLYNAAFGSDVKLSSLKGSDPILRRLERHTRDKFDHGPPATELLRRKAEVLPKLAAETLDRFEKLFAIINKTLR